MRCRLVFARWTPLLRGQHPSTASHPAVQSQRHAAQAQRSAASKPAGVTPSERLGSLRRLLREREASGGGVVRAIEVHSGLCGLIAEHAIAERSDGRLVGFDAMWSSSLTSSSIKGKPDIETVDTTARLGIVQDALEVSTKPMIYDGDTGGLPEIFHFTVRSLERLGVSAVVIEDKAGLKQNSLFGTDRKQQLESVDEFCAKIRAGNAAKLSEDFMIVSRLEAMIAGWGVEEALTRAKAYIAAGTDAIMVHSKEKSPDEVLLFLERYARFEHRVPVVAVPTTYNTITEAELSAAGADICIYANQLLRASYPAMNKVAQTILANGRSMEVDKQILPVKEILTLIDDNSGHGVTTCAKTWAGPRHFTGNGSKPAPALAPAKSEPEPLDPARLFEELRRRGVDYFTGVPDSQMKDFLSYLDEATASSGSGAQNIVTANEGSSVALASGHHLATGGLPLVYMQNSGLGNAVNPLMSLVDPRVYSVPMLLLIGWRGEPGKKDEPQHLVMGQAMTRMLDVLGIPYQALPRDPRGMEDVLDAAVRSARERSAPFALLVKKNLFKKHSFERPRSEDEGAMLREEIIRAALPSLSPEDAVVGTTGYTSREIFEHREAAQQDHSRDFLTVGSMGHASAIALGVARAQPTRRVVCLDGDGSTLMHMGNMATVAMSGCSNFKHVVVNNAAHDSVGAQPSGMENVDVVGLANALGYRWAAQATSADEFAGKFAELLEASGPALLEVRSRPGARKDLGRPTTSPGENKEAFMSFLRGKPL